MNPAHYITLSLHGAAKSANFMQSALLLEKGGYEFVSGFINDFIFILP